MQLYSDFDVMHQEILRRAATNCFLISNIYIYFLFIKRISKKLVVGVEGLGF